MSGPADTVPVISPEITALRDEITRLRTSLAAKRADVAASGSGVYSADFWSDIRRREEQIATTGRELHALLAAAPRVPWLDRDWWRRG
jgi:hypothetical protein